MENITVDLIPGYAPRAVCHVSQNDINRPIKITLKNYGERYELTGEEVLTLKVRTLRAKITAEVENPGGDEIIIKASQEMTATQGQNLCELVIKDKSKSIGAANFCMEVEQGGVLIPDRRANT